MKLVSEKKRIDLLIDSLIITFFFGLLFSRALLSVSAVLIFFTLFLHFNPEELLKGLRQNPAIWLFFLLLIVYLTDIFRSPIREEFFNDFKNKLFFFILPAAFLSAYVKKPASGHLTLILIFIFLVVVTGFLTFFTYLFNYEYFNQIILRSKPIPVWGGLNHIYYSLMLSFSTIIVMLLLVVYRTQVSLSVLKYHRLIKAFLWGSLFAGIVFLHTISAKTGLAAFYIALIIIVLYLSLIYRKVLLAAITLLLIALMFVLSVKYIPPLHNRWNKLTEDLISYQQHKDINHLSLSTRIEYWKASWSVFKENTVAGVGNSKVEKKMAEYFQQTGSVLNEENRRGPHNQYLHVLAGTGIIGFLVFIAILIFLFKKAVYSRNPLMLAILLISCSGFLFESVLERQAGICFFIFFSLFTDNEIFSLKINKA